MEGPLLIKLELLAVSTGAPPNDVDTATRTGSGERELPAVMATAMTIQSNPAAPQDWTAFGPLRQDQAQWVDAGVTVERSVIDLSHSDVLNSGMPAESIITVTLTLPTTAAYALFYAELQLIDLTVPGGEDNRILPVWWSDNFVTLLPGESVVLTAQFARADVQVGAYLAIKLTGWNVNPTVTPLI
jgi:hypothetical protein